MQKRDKKRLTRHGRTQPTKRGYVGGAWMATKAAFQHRRVLRLGGGRFRHGAIIFHNVISLWCWLFVTQYTFFPSSHVAGITLKIWPELATRSSGYCPTGSSCTFFQSDFFTLASVFNFIVAMTFFLPARFIAFGSTNIRALFVFANSLMKKMGNLFANAKTRQKAANSAWPYTAD